MSYAKWQVFPNSPEETFEHWVKNRFGARLYSHFFRAYTEKVWGISCTAITADWAAQRIRNLSLRKAIWNAISGSNDTASLIEQFEYPRLGPGMMWEKCRDLIFKRGGEVRMNTSVTRINRNGNRIELIEINQAGGAQRVYADEFISTMALVDLIACIEPSPPEHVCAAAKRLNYRDFLVVTLILDHPDPFPDNWIYVHSGDVKVGRIQNFRAWSQDMVPDPEKSSVGLEYFCHSGDGLWTNSDANLIALAAEELDLLGLVSKSSVVEGVVIRQEKAYPVYDTGYSEAVAVIKEWLGTLENFQTVGRNGLHRYNNQDHSMLTAILAVRNLTGEKHDVWDVNVERSYHEKFEIAASFRVRCKQRTGFQHMRSKTRIVAIVPARNATTTLPACLDALMNSSCKPDEIIIFDDGLNPNIGEFAKADLISIVHNDGVQMGVAGARNLAARQASADILAFVDADVIVEKEALGRLVAALGSEIEVAAAFGCYDNAPPGKRLAGLYVNLRHHWIHKQSDPEPATFWAGIGVVHADVFWALGGFDEISKIEDIDFGIRLRAAGKKIRFVPDAQGMHLKDWRLLQLWKTDIVDRAFPWALLIARGAPSTQLNASHKERISAIFAYGLLISLLGSFATFWLRLDAAIFAGLYIFHNRGLFGLIARRGGARGLIVGMALHWFYHIYASAIFVVVQVTAKARAVHSGVWRILARCVAPNAATAGVLREPPTNS